MIPQDIRPSLWECSMLTFNQTVAAGCSISSQIGPCMPFYYCWPFLIAFQRQEKKQKLQQPVSAHTVGKTGSWTVTQTHEKRAVETLKGGPIAP